MRFKSDLKYSDVTPKAAWLNRRQIIAGATGLGTLAVLPALGAGRDAPLGTPNTFEQISTYNNFLELGSGKDRPSENAHLLTTDPWAGSGPAPMIWGTFWPAW